MNLHRISSMPAVTCIFLLFLSCRAKQETGPGVVSAANYSSIQAALDANPGKPVFLPPGVHSISTAIKIEADGSGLFGLGTILQTNADEDILVLKNAAHVRIEGVTLKRADPKMGKQALAIRADKSPSLWLKDLRILDNRSGVAAVYVTDSDYCRIEGCEIINYKTIHVDDRMKDPLYRYAFNAIDGHGLRVLRSKAPQILHNRVIERELLPTKETQEKYQLGKIVAQAEQLGPLASYGVSKDNFVFIWHQGAGIQISDATKSSLALIDGNYIENPAQGMDIHCDFVTITNNLVTNSYIGMKAFHGSRGVLITNNVFHAPGKYGILLRPGSASHLPQLAHGGKPAKEENVERGIIVSNNLITDMGYGIEDWRLRNDDPKESSPVAIKVGYGPLTENPTLKDVLIHGNIVYDRAGDGILMGSKSQVASHGYKWAVWMDTAPQPQDDLRFQNNIFHPGSQGVSNRELPRGQAR